MTNNNNDETKQSNHALIGNFLTFIGLCISVAISLYSLDIAKHANTVAEDALSHQKIIEESDLQIGTSVSGKNNFNETFIRVPIINGYYARYQASIIAERINIYLNDNTPIKLYIEPHYKFLINKDNPTYFDFVFNNSDRNHSDFDSDVITIHLPGEKIKEKSNYLLIKIPYNDFTLNGNENKMIFLEYHFDFTNGSIKVTEKNASRFPIEIAEYKVILQNR